MAKADRILERLLRTPPEMRFSEIKTLLTARGWAIRPGGGSHWILTSPTGKTITISTVKGRTIKRKQLRMIARELS